MSQQLTSQSFTASLRFLACDSGITVLFDVTMHQVKISLRKEVAIVFPGFDVGGLGTVHGMREAQSLESEAAGTTLYQQPGNKMMLSLGHQLTFLFHGRLEQVPDHEYNFQLDISRNTSTDSLEVNVLAIVYPIIDSQEEPSMFLHTHKTLDSLSFPPLLILVIFCLH